MSFALDLGKAPAAGPCGPQRFAERGLSVHQPAKAASQTRRLDLAGPRARSQSWLVERASAAAATARSTPLTSRTAPVSAEVAIAA